MSDSKITSSLSLRRALWPFGWRAEYLFSAPLERFGLSSIISNLVPALLGPIIGRSAVLRDYKGRDRPQLIDPALSGASLPAGDELLYVEGSILDAPGRAGERFSFALTTEFDSFEEPHHIIYRRKEHRTENLPSEVERNDLGQAVLLEPTLLRIGIDHFHSRFISAWFGFAPTVYETLLIEANDRIFKLKIEAEEIRRRETIPLQADGTWKRLSAVLSREFGFDLTADYINRAK